MLSKPSYQKELRELPELQEIPSKSLQNLHCPFSCRCRWCTDGASDALPRIVDAWSPRLYFDRERMFEYWAALCKEEREMAEAYRAPRRRVLLEIFQSWLAPLVVAYDLEIDLAAVVPRVHKKTWLTDQQWRDCYNEDTGLAKITLYFDEDRNELRIMEEVD